MRNISTIVRSAPPSAGAVHPHDVRLRRVATMIADAHDGMLGEIAARTAAEFPSRLPSVAPPVRAGSLRLHDFTDEPAALLPRHTALMDVMGYGEEGARREGPTSIIARARGPESDWSQADIERLVDAFSWPAGDAIDMTLYPNLLHLARAPLCSSPHYILTIDVRDDPSAPETTRGAAAFRMGLQAAENATRDMTVVVRSVSEGGDPGSDGDIMAGTMLERYTPALHLSRFIKRRSGFIPSPPPVPCRVLLAFPTHRFTEFDPVTPDIEGEDDGFAGIGSMRDTLRQMSIDVPVDDGITDGAGEIPCKILKVRHPSSVVTEFRFFRDMGADAVQIVTSSAEDEARRLRNKKKNEQRRRKKIERREIGESETAGEAVHALPFAPRRRCIRCKRE